MKNTRREFLKKVAYTAPSVIALGTLVAPTDASATFFGNSCNNGNNGNNGHHNNNGNHDNSRNRRRHNHKHSWF